MKNILLLATTLLLGTAAAASVSGSQTTPLTLQVNNFCQLANVGGVTSPSFDRTYPTLDLGIINAITNNSVSSVVAAVDCNRGTALNVHLPSSVTLSNGTTAVNVTTDTWDDQHPLTMSFDQSGSFTNDYGYGPYDYHEVKATFKVGGSATLSNRAWSIPGGTYTGNLVITYDYNE